MSPVQRSQRVPLLSTGLLCLALSFVITALSNGGAPAAMAWVQSAAWWVGLICIAGHVLRLAVHPMGPSENTTTVSDLTRH